MDMSIKTYPPFPDIDYGGSAPTHKQPNNIYQYF